MGEHCVVLVANSNYFQKAFTTIYNLRTVGIYSGTIVLITDESSLLENNDPNFYNVADSLSITIKTFENIDLSYVLRKINEKPFLQSIDRRELTKTFQWHKLHIFDTYFKQWKHILYIDSGMNIYKDIETFWDIVKNYSDDVLLAHSDTYPEFKNNYKNQFEQLSYPETFQELENLVDLSCDNFQTTMLLFNSDIITTSTKADLIFYTNKFPISKTNEQGIMNIYFNGVFKIWKPLPTYWNNMFTYDFWNRGTFQPSEYIMTKYTR